MNTYLCAFLGTAMATILWTPVVIHLGRRFKVLDHPGLRKIHKEPVPRLGGVAIALPALVMVGLVCALDNGIGRMFQNEWVEISALLGGAFWLFLVGLMDDLRGLRARTKLFAQILAALAVCLCGIRFESFQLEGLGMVHLGQWSWPLTVLWIVGMTNALNLIDGLDGLATGISSITILVVAIVALSLGQAVMAILMLTCLGALLAFLVFNFNPAKIFLGDSGTYFLGFFLGAGSLLTSTKSGALIGLTIPLLAMGIPIFDTLFVMLRRILERKPLFAPDRGHVHHRLVAMGLTQKKAVIILYSITVILTSCGMFMMMARNLASIILLLCLLILLITAFRMLGAVRLRETLAGIKRRRAITRAIQNERDVFQETDLRLREATTFEDWWQSLCGAAEDLGFASLSVVVTNCNGSMKRLYWHHSEDTHERRPCTTISIPLEDKTSGLAMEIDARIFERGSIESVGRKVALFGRLLEPDSRPFLVEETTV